ncbi:MAG TPA: hypothetical protein PKE10_02705, partial [Candidatus Saccharibacteria bacterium]|nr:hypothetical protein [Candidatus Saccharibacteria bacterium]
GASAGLPAQALGLSLHGSAVLLEIGSDLVVKSHQRKYLTFVRYFLLRDHAIKLWLVFTSICDKEDRTNDKTRRDNRKVNYLAQSIGQKAVTSSKAIPTSVRDSLATNNCVDHINLCD